jgi:hypothetical protein
LPLFFWRSCFRFMIWSVMSAGCKESDPWLAELIEKR